MSRSRFLDKQTKEEREKLVKTLSEIQKGDCFICGNPIDLVIQSFDIDHKIPLNIGGKDEVVNFVLTHGGCNRSKQDQNLEVARTIASYEAIKDSVFEEDKRSPDLNDILTHYGGSSKTLNIKIGNDLVTYAYNNESAKTYTSTVFTDSLSGFKSFFINLPIEYLYHDEKGLNPRPLSENVKKLIKEFYNKHPQLHIGLGRIDSDGAKNKKVFIFDGQHKSAASVLLGIRSILLRVFIDPNIQVLAETNEKAGTTLKQVPFDKSVQRNLGNTILQWKIENYQSRKGLDKDNYAFSEQDFINFYRGEGREVKTYILDSVRHRVTIHSNNNLMKFVSLGGKGKVLPLSYSAVEKTFFATFLSKDLLDVRPFDSSQRQQEIDNLVKFMNIVAEKICNGYDITVGTYRMEDKVRQEKDKNESSGVSDRQLRIVRLLKEEVMHNWVRLSKQIISSYYIMNGLIIDENSIFQNEIDDVAWNSVETFFDNLVELPLWVDRSQTYLFSAKNSSNYWHSIFRTGMSPDGIKAMPYGINMNDMIRRFDQK